jgi:hypothetical protein
MDVAGLDGGGLTFFDLVGEGFEDRAQGIAPHLLEAALAFVGGEIPHQ